MFFADGKRVLACGHEAGHGVRCYVQDLPSGKPVAVTPEGANLARPSPDGTQLVAYVGEEGLKLFPIPLGEGRPVPGATDSDLVLRWTPDGKAVLVTSVWSDMPARIERLDLATGRREPYQTLGPADPTGAVQVAPIALSDDGKSHAYGVRRMASHLFVLSGAK